MSLHWFNDAGHPSPTYRGWAAWGNMAASATAGATVITMAKAPDARLFE
jgi:hypothetical protein